MKVAVFDSVQLGLCATKHSAGMKTTIATEAASDVEMTVSKTYTGKQIGAGAHATTAPASATAHPRTLFSYSGSAGNVLKQIVLSGGGGKHRLVLEVDARKMEPNEELKQRDAWFEVGSRVVSEEEISDEYLIRSCDVTKLALVEYICFTGDWVLFKYGLYISVAVGRTGFEDVAGRSSQNAQGLGIFGDQFAQIIKNLLLLGNLKILLLKPFVCFPFY